MNRKELKAAAKASLGGKLFSNEWLLAILMTLLVGVILSVSTFGVVVPLILSGPLTYGMNKQYLKCARNGGAVDIGKVFDGFTDDFAGTLLLGLLSGLFVFLWGLLFVVPGIIKSLSYSMMYFVKADHPEYNWSRCLKESESMMKGHKGELFVLYLSFIPFALVGSLCLGIGSLWCPPYANASVAQFYLRIAPAEAVDGAYTSYAE